MHIKIYASVDYGKVKIGEVLAYGNIYTLAIDSLYAESHDSFFYST
jgi:hypothetical protein